MAGRATKVMGRPPKAEGERKSRNFTFRGRERLHQALQADAVASGRSISEEIESRLERSYAEQEYAALVSFGAPHNTQLARRVLVCATAIEDGYGKPWIESESAARALVAAFNQLVANPSVEPSPGVLKVTATILSRDADEVGRTVADVIMRPAMGTLFGVKSQDQGENE